MRVRLLELESALNLASTRSFSNWLDGYVSCGDEDDEDDEPDMVAYECPKIIAAQDFT